MATPLASQAEATCIARGTPPVENAEVAIPRSSSMTPRRWIEYSAAVLIGNGLYFLVLYPGLPALLQHQPFRVDPGLVLDFACCVAVYGVIRLGVAHAHRNPKRSPGRWLW